LAVNSEVGCDRFAAAGALWSAISAALQSRLPTGRRSRRRFPDAVARLYDGGHAFFMQDPAAMPDVIDFLR
jgi:hypothetical protein